MEYLLEYTQRTADKLAWEQRAMRFEAKNDETAIERVNQLIQDGKHPAELSRMIKKW